MLLLRAAFENLPLCIKRTPFHQKRTRFHQNLLTLSGFKLNVSNVDATECGLADAGLISGAALGQVNQKVTSFQLGRNCSSNRRPNQGLGVGFALPVENLTLLEKKLPTLERP